MKTRPLEDSMPLIEDVEQLRNRANRDGFLFMRGLLPNDAVWRCAGLFSITRVRSAGCIPALPWMKGAPQRESESDTIRIRNG